MAGISQIDLERVLEVVQRVGEAHDPDEFARAVIKHLADLVPSDVMSLNEVDPEADRINYLTEPESWSAGSELDARIMELADEHPLISYYMSTNDGSAKKISDFWTDEEFHGSRIYREVYSKIGIEYQISLALPAPRPIVVAIVAVRASSDFTERDRAVLNALRPHLVQAWFNAKDQYRLRSLLSAASDATAHSGAELIVLTDPPQELTSGALVSLYRHFGRPSLASPLPTRVERWLDAQRSRLDDYGSLEVSKPLMSAGTDGRMVIRYLPAQGDHPGALLLRPEPIHPQEQNLESLGLTEREAEVVRCVISGQTNADVASTLHVSAGTVKKHLDNIYRKLGVSGRGHLTAFVLDIVQR